MGPAKPGETHGLRGTGSGLTYQDSAGWVFGWVWNQTYPFFRSKPGPLAGYPDPLLILLTAEFLADFFTKQLLKPALSKQCAAMGMTGMDVRSSLRNGIGMELEWPQKWPRYSSTWSQKWYRNWNWKWRWDSHWKQYWLGIIVLMRSTMFDWLLFSFLHCLWFETDVLASLEKCLADWKYRYQYGKDYNIIYLFWSEHHQSSIDRMWMQHVSLHNTIKTPSRISGHMLLLKPTPPCNTSLCLHLGCVCRITFKTLMQSREEGDKMVYEGKIHM